MTKYRIPEIPEIESACRAAFKALEPLVPPGHQFTAEADSDFWEIQQQFNWMTRTAEDAIAANLGPRIMWEDCDHERAEWQLTATAIDLDGEDRGFGSIDLDESAYGNDGEGWAGCPLNRASVAYRREAGWDFEPGEAGIWLLMLAPVQSWNFSSETTWRYSGYLAGFVILYDRDEDGTYEAVGHIWTARAWRRQGVARRLLSEAKTRFGYQHIEGPYTSDGAALVRTLDGDAP